MRKIILHCAVFAALALVASGALSAAALKIVTVDCADGDSINKALEKRDDELIINVVGICVEDVVVRRDRVTLRGVDPALDGIQAATVTDVFGATLLIRGARFVRVENLSLSGAKRAGLRIEDSRREIEVVNTRVENNQEFGVVMAAAQATATDLVVVNNGFAGIGISETAVLQCDNCTVSDNPAPDRGYGLYSVLASLARFNGGVISARYPVWIHSSAFGIFNGTTVVGEIALRAGKSGDITFSGGTVDGSIWLQGDSQATLLGAQQSVNTAGVNFVSGGSHLTLGGSGGLAAASLVGDTYFEEFSRGIFGAGTGAGVLTCASGSDAICAAGVLMGGSNCASCP